MSLIYPLMHRTRKTGTEQYYTPADVATHCVSVMDSIALADTYLEPCGGTGAFIEALGGRRVISFDIEPKHPQVQLTDDFLKENISELSNVITLTNPPFGRANSLCIPFFNKCADVSDYIAFIVPKSWRKWSVENRLDRRFWKVHDEELFIDYITDNNTSKGRLATVFQVWEKRQLLRPIVRVPDYGYLKKVKDPATADVALTVFGHGCGTVLTEFPQVPNTTKMFLKLQHSEALQALQSVDFSRFYNNVAFTKALSFQEINYLVNEYLSTNTQK